MPTRKTTNEVDFSEIFNFADQKPWNIGWNEANDVFFNKVLDYKSWNDFYASDLEGDIEHIKERGEDRYDYLQAKEIILAFMKHHDLDEMRVLND